METEEEIIKRIAELKETIQQATDELEASSGESTETAERLEKTSPTPESPTLSTDEFWSRLPRPSAPMSKTSPTITPTTPAEPTMAPDALDPSAQSAPLMSEIVYTPQTIEAIELEKALDDTRAKYAEAYKKFLADRRGKIGRLKNIKEHVFGVKIADSETPDELKILEKEYEKATIEYGEKMYSDKEEELRRSTLPDDEKKAELARFKQNEIFTRVIIQEHSMLNALKVENLPPKEKGLIKRTLGWYLDPKTSRWKKLAISTTLGTVVIMGISGSTVATAGGVMYYAGLRFTRGAVGAVMGQAANKLFDRLVKEKSTEKKELEENELAEIFRGETLDTSLAKSKKEYEEILEREKKAKRDRLITKAMIGLAVGIGTSVAMSYGIGQITHNTPNQLHGSTSAKESTPTATDDLLHKANLKLHEARLKAVADAKALEDVKSTSSAPKILETDTINKPDTIAIIHKGEGIEHTFRKQIEHDPELAKKLKFEGDINDPKALHEFSGKAAHRLAVEKGYVDETGNHEVRITQAEKVAYEVKLDQNGHVVVTEKTIDGKILGQYEEGKKYSFGENSDNPYDKNSNAIKTPGNDQIIKTPETGRSYSNLVESSPAKTAEEAIRNKLDAAFEKTNQTPANLDHPQTNTETGNTEARGVSSTSHNKDTGSPTANTLTPAEKLIPRYRELVGKYKNPFELTPSNLVQAYETHEHNIAHLFPGNKIDEWESLRSLKAKDWVHEGDIGENSNPLLKYLNRLANLTGLIPKSGNLLRGAETVESYAVRALQKATEMKELNMLKIEN